MALKIFWTKRALNNFDKILEYLEKELGETTTRAFAIKVHNFVDNLQDFPELGTLQNSEKQIRGFVIVKQVTIFYQISDDRIKILNLFDNRQNPKKK
jgi:plasmid stabilization system protein ParE